MSKGRGQTEGEHFLFGFPEIKEQVAQVEFRTQKKKGSSNISYRMVEIKAFLALGRVVTMKHFNLYHLRFGQSCVRSVYMCQVCAKEKDDSLHPNN